MALVPWSLSPALVELHRDDPLHCRKKKLLRFAADEESRS